MSPYRHALQQLSAVYPPGEATSLVRLLFEERFGLSLTDVLLGKDSNLSANECRELQNIVERMLKNEPIQYILGHTTFCGLTLKVAPGVLIPRPETAELVEWVAAEQAGKGPVRVLDVGTGSGCIALALAQRGLDVEAWDVSEEALAIARENALSTGLKVVFKRKNVLHMAPQETVGEYDVIVSNPPYICHREAAEMERNVLDYEPHLALFVPDDDPLLFYRAITRMASCMLREGGTLYFEINRAYGKEMLAMMAEEGFCEMEVRKDQFGNERMMKAVCSGRKA